MPLDTGTRRHSVTPQTRRTVDLVEEFWDLEIVEGLYRQCAPAGPNDFRDAFHQLFERRGRLLLTGSARQALRIVLASAASGSHRERVLASSFNCRVVKEAVRSAGLAIDTFDLATPRGQFDWEAIARTFTNQHLAIVVPHFFGIPTDFTAMIPSARRNGVLIVEDCAHTLGAAIGGTPAGLLGDAAVFSFNYDKPISLAGGGALLLNSPAVEIDRATVEVPTAARLELHQFRRLAARLQFGRTRAGRWPLLERIGAKLHVSPYAMPPLPTGIGALRSAVGIWQLERYEAVRRCRDRNAQFLRDSLGQLPWLVATTVTPAHLKLRVTVSPADAAVAVRQCRQQRIVVANSNWPTPITPDGLQDVRVNAYRAATFGLDVPIHQNLSPADLRNIASAFAHVPAPDWASQE